MACQSNSRTAVVNHVVPLTKESSPNKINCDTTINYNIDSFSSEGVEIKGCYSNKRLIKAEISIYGSAGRSNLTYLILNDSIMVNERNYIYKVALSEIKNNSDIKLKDSSSYILDISKRQVIQGHGNNNDKLNVLTIFLNNVPLRLK